MSSSNSPWGQVVQDQPSQPIGIDGLSPQADDIVVGGAGNSGSWVPGATSCSPIGTDASGFMSFLSSPPPQHMVGLFNRSDKSAVFHRSLDIGSPGTTPQQPPESSHRGVDHEDILDLTLPPSSGYGLSEHDEWLMGMGGMEDIQPAKMQAQRRQRSVSTLTFSSSMLHQASRPLSARQVPAIDAFSVARSLGSSPVGLQSYLQMSSLNSPRSEASAQSPGTSGEHPFGEHPSRTLFVRNINSSISDDELRACFEVYGPIRSIYTQCKHRGFVMISYYDIRHSLAAINVLQGTILRRRKLDIHFSIPKDNPSEKDQNQGTLVVFNLDPAINNEELCAIFGRYGEIKEVRETPNKKHHKFIEYYDVRNAEMAMRMLNKTDINSKTIKIEASRPGGLRKSTVTHSPIQVVPQIHSAPVSPRLSYSDDSLLRSAPAANDLPPYARATSSQGTLEVPATSRGLSLSPGSRHTLRTLVDDHPGLLRANKDLSPSMLAYSGSSAFGPPISIPVEKPRTSLGVMRTVWSPSSTELSSTAPAVMTIPQIVSPRIRSSDPYAMGSSYDSNRHANASRPSRNADSGVSQYQGHHSGHSHSYTHSNGPNHHANQHSKRGRSKNQSPAQFVLDVAAVRAGSDSRTTLMIKNIPNKYTQKMLLATINQEFQGHYDFFYLPIDFKNKCNVGYAFINFVHIKFIPAFYSRLHSTKWSRFNSEKVCKISYARIQGKDALVDHFRNSTLLSEDKKCRPIIFHSEGPLAGQQAPFPLPSRHRRDDGKHGRSQSHSKRK